MPLAVSPSAVAWQISGKLQKSPGLFSGAGPAACTSTGALFYYGLLVGSAEVSPRLPASPAVWCLDCAPIDVKGLRQKWTTTNNITANQMSQTESKVRLASDGKNVITIVVTLLWLGVCSRVVTRLVLILIVSGSSPWIWITAVRRSAAWWSSTPSTIGLFLSRAGTLAWLVKIAASRSCSSHWLFLLLLTH